MIMFISANHANFDMVNMDVLSTGKPNVLLQAVLNNSLYLMSRAFFVTKSKVFNMAKGLVYHGGDWCDSFGLFSTHDICCDTGELQVFLGRRREKQFGSFEAIKWSTIFSPALHATAILCIAGDINVNL